MRRALTSFAGLALAASAAAFTVDISDADDMRQACSGMWGGKNAEISVVFDEGAKGQVAVAIWEWSDMKYLGKPTPGQHTEEFPKTYVCTTTAFRSNPPLCTSDELGQFIVDLPEGKSINSTSIWTTAARFSDVDVGTENGGEAAGAVEDDAGSSSGTGTRNGRLKEVTPAGGEEDDEVEAGVPDEEEEEERRIVRRQVLQPNPGPFTYPAKKSGYYCVGTVPITVVTPAIDASQAHGSFTGSVYFNDQSGGELPASEVPLLGFYAAMSWIYVMLAAGWGFLCWRNRDELLRIQHYVTGLLVFLILENFLNWGYYHYLSVTPPSASPVVSTLLLALTALASALRSSASFFLLLTISLGLAVVRPSLDPTTMKRVVILTAAHALFGVVYAIGTVLVRLEEAAIFLLLLMILPLAFTLSAFLLWTLYSLNGTIAHLELRRQKFKVGMYKKVYRILMGAVIIIAGFFILSTFSFSNRFDDNFAPSNWKWRWFLLDGWLGLLYLAVLVSIAYLWRPSPQNARLALSDELATDEDEANEFDLAERGNAQSPTQDGGDRRQPPPRYEHDELPADETVFALDDEDEDTAADLDRELERHKEGLGERATGSRGEEGERLLGRSRSPSPDGKKRD